MEIPEEEKVQVKATWKLAWGLWWKMFLITLGIWAIIAVISWFTVLGSMLTPLFALFGAFGG
jgi:hypothetical protein